MIKTSFTLKLNEKAPDFNLKSTSEKIYSLSDYQQYSALVIFFTCNHCPYVKNSDEDTRKIVQKFSDSSIKFVAINSNSANTYEEDSFENMCQRMEQHKFPWDYLHDKEQTTAKAYGALRTPHFFLFDKNRELIYCGRAIDNPKDPSKASSHDLENALQEYFAGKPISKPLTNPIGCNVKWEGKDKHWMPDDACDII